MTDECEVCGERKIDPESVPWCCDAVEVVMRKARIAEIAKLRCDLLSMSAQLDEALATITRWEAERDEAPYRVFAPARPCECKHLRIASHTAGHPWQECADCGATRVALMYESYIPGGPEWTPWRPRNEAMLPPP
jgi:hypothetical protein